MSELSNGGVSWPALDTATVSRLSGVPISTLNSWIDKKLCTPSLIGPAGHRFARYWAPRDLVVVRSIRMLRSAGCSMQMLRKARRMIERGLSPNDKDKVAFYDGHDIVMMSPDDGSLVSAFQEPGQAMFKQWTLRVSLPLSEWLSEASERAEKSPIDLVEVRDRRNRVAARQTMHQPGRTIPRSRPQAG